MKIHETSWIPMKPNKRIFSNLKFIIEIYIYKVQRRCWTLIFVNNVKYITTLPINMASRSSHSVSNKSINYLQSINLKIHRNSIMTISLSEWASLEIYRRGLRVLLSRLIIILDRVAIMKAVSGFRIFLQWFRVSILSLGLSIIGIIGLLRSQRRLERFRFLLNLLKERKLWSRSHLKWFISNRIIYLLCTSAEDRFSTPSTNRRIREPSVQAILQK